MSHPYLLLWLEGPLQSWGHDSRFGRRDSLPFPTKSGVMGIICAALGAAGPQEPLLDMQVLGFSRQDKNGTVALREPLLCDFHMVGSGYDDKDPWQSLLIPKKSDGKKAVGGGTKITYRYYLQDRAFAGGASRFVSNLSRSFTISNVGSGIGAQKLCANRIYLSRTIFQFIGC